MKRHVEGFHMKIRKCHCEECGCWLLVKQGHDNHVKAAHMKINDNMCELCDNSSSTKGHLQARFKSVHLHRSRTLSARNVENISVFKVPLIITKSAFTEAKKG